MLKNVSRKTWVIIILCAVLAIALLLTCVITATMSDENRLKYALNEDGQSYSVIDIKNAYRGGWFAKDTIVIPKTHKNLPVTAIVTIKDLKKTSTVVLPDGLKEIGASAFYGCSITSLDIPDSVTKIGTSAFENCTSLSEIKLPSNLTSISSGMLRSCFSLAQIELPSTVTTIGSGAFANCYSLETIELPAGVTSIGKNAFADCTGLTSIELPSNLRTIDADAFKNCYSLIEVCNNSDLPIVAWSSGYGDVAYNALNVYSDTQGESYLKTDSGNVFYDDGEQVLFVKHYGKDTTLSLPSGFGGHDYSIHRYAMYGNSTIVEVVIPSGVTQISYSAFENCSKLEKVSIGDDVTLIQEGAFRGSRKLNAVTFGKGVKEIEKRSFYECSSIQSIQLHDAIEKIGDEAFAACSQLKQVTIGKGLKSIGDKAFFNCAHFTEMHFGGTKADWQSVQLGSQWTWDNNSNMRDRSCEKVVCSDGDVVIPSTKD